MSLIDSSLQLHDRWRLDALFLCAFNSTCMTSLLLDPLEMLLVLPSARWRMDDRSCGLVAHALVTVKQ